MSFFGTVVQPQGSTPFVPPPEDWSLHLSQAALAADVPVGARVSLLVKHGDEEPIILATLCAGTQDSVALDLFFTQYAEFSVKGGKQGSFPVHLSGYFSPETVDGPSGPGESDSDEGEDEGEGGYAEELATLMKHPKGAAARRLMAQLASGGADMDEDEDDEDEGDEDEDDELDEDESDEEMGLGGSRRQPSVIIEEVTEEEAVRIATQAKAAQEEAAAPAPAKGSKRPVEEAAGVPAKKQATEKADKKKTAKPQTPAPAEAKAKPTAEVKTPPTKAKPAEAAAKATPGKAGEVSTGKKNVRRWENGFEITDVALGEPSGKLAKAGKVVLVRYTGRLKSNGKVFDSSKGAPFKFRLGVGEVISGWDKGVEGMRVGSKRKLVIPPQMGYGSTGMKPVIPPNATLEFDVELVDVK